MIVEEDVAGIGLNHAAHQVKQSRLATAAGADDCDSLANVDLKRCRIKGHSAWVGLGHLVKPNGPLLFVRCRH